jgi:hypothetical protein
MLELDDFVLDTEFLTLQAGDRIKIGQRPVDFTIDGFFETAMARAKGLDMIR